MNETPDSANDSAGPTGDVPVTVSVEIGRCTMSAREAMQLQVKSMVRTDTPDDEPVDLLVNGMLVGHGWVKPQNGRFALEISVLDPEKRRAALKR